MTRQAMPLGVTVSGIVGSKTRRSAERSAEWEDHGKQFAVGQRPRVEQADAALSRHSRMGPRLYPCLMLGVYTQDEMLDAAERARDVTPPTPRETIAALPQRQQQPAETRTDAPYAGDAAGRAGNYREIPGFIPNPPPPATEERIRPRPQAERMRRRDAPTRLLRRPPTMVATTKAFFADLEDEMAIPTRSHSRRDPRSCEGTMAGRGADRKSSNARKAIYQRNVRRVKGGKDHGSTTGYRRGPPPPVAETKPVEPKADDARHGSKKVAKAFDDGMAFQQISTVAEIRAMIDAKQSWLDGWSAAESAKRKVVWRKPNSRQRPAG